MKKNKEEQESNESSKSNSESEETKSSQTFINEELRSQFSVVGDLLKKNGRKVKTFSSPHKNKTRNICDFVIIHYTGSHGTYSSSVNWAGNPKSKVSWHLTIGRKGEICQHEDGFRTVLWHAGKSEWVAENIGRTYQNLNGYSIGIEIANSGKLTKNEEGKWVNPYGKVFKDNDVFIAADGSGWEKYTDAQIETTCAVALVLAEHYNCVDILGHEDIAPGRKIDPGPGFPTQKLRDELRKQSFYKFK